MRCTPACVCFHWIRWMLARRARSRRKLKRVRRLQRRLTVMKRARKGATRRRVTRMKTEESSYDEDETEEEEEEEATSGEEEEEEEMVVEKPKSKKQKDLEELAMASNLSIEVLMSMSRNEVEELRKSVQQALARSRRARVTIVAPRAP